MASYHGGTPVRGGLRRRRRRNLDDPLIWYLEADILPEDLSEARKIKKQAARYCISQEKMYRRYFSGPYLRCVTPREAARILVELHEGDCGSHSSGRSLVLRARRAGYYWPTMAADRQAKHCDQCQRHAPVSKLSLENLKSISSPWPFRKWGKDIVGKFPMAPGQKVFLLIVTDYFSKWVEAEALSETSLVHGSTSAEKRWTLVFQQVPTFKTASQITSNVKLNDYNKALSGRQPTTR